jgi:WD40 repeat protein
MRLVANPEAAELRIEDLDGKRLGAIPWDLSRTVLVWWHPDAAHIVLIVGGVPYLWDVADPSAPRMIAELHAKGQDDDVPGIWLTTAAFSPDGKITAIVRHRAGIATLFDTRTGRRRGVIALDRGTMPAAAFSPDGRTIAVVNATYRGDASTGVEFYNVATGKRRAFLSLPNIAPSFGSIAYIRGGAAFVTESVDKIDSADDPGAGSLQIWDTATLRPIGEPLAMPGIPTPTSSSPDGKRIVTGTTGNFAVVWDVNVASWRRTACETAGRKLTRVEWDQYLPGRPYDPFCA